jgi:hypothetical protein
MASTQSLALHPASTQSAQSSSAYYHVHTLLHSSVLPRRSPTSTYAQKANDDKRRMQH